MKKLRVLLALAWSVMAVLGSSAAAVSASELLSVTTKGEQGFDDFLDPATSADGGVAAFVSTDNTFHHPPPINGNINRSIYVRDRESGLTTRISDKVQADSKNFGVGADGDSFSPSLSGDGRFVVFTSFASNLVKQGSNNTSQILMYDRTTRRTSLVSARPDGKAASGACILPSISGNGRYVVFLSDASDLVAGDTNGDQDVFVRDTVRGKTERVSVKTGGTQSNAVTPSGSTPRLSYDGRLVVFSSSAPDLVTQDNNGSTPDIFLHDRETGATTLISKYTESVRNYQPDISADGRYVAYAGFSTAFSDADPSALDGQGAAFVYDRAQDVLNFSRSSSSSPKLSADGHLIAYIEKSSGSNVEVKVYDQNTFRTIFAAVRYMSTGNIETTPALSSDGSTVLFQTSEAWSGDDFNNSADIFATPLFDTITLEQAAFYVSERDGSFTFSVRRTGTSLGAVSVKYSISAPGDTAVEGTDYQFPSDGATGTLSWADGDSTDQLVTLPIINRSFSVEGYRSFTVALNSPSPGVRLTIPSTVIVIRDSNSQPVEDLQGHGLKITSVVAAGTSWADTLFRGKFTIHNPSGLPSFRGQIDYLYQPLDTVTRRPVGDPFVEDVASVDTVPAGGDLSFISQVNLASEFDGTHLDGILYAQLYELTPNGDRILQDTALASNFNTTEGLAPPAGGATQPNSGIDAPGFNPIRVQSVTISAPAQIPEDTNATCTATVTLTDGSILSGVTPHWKTSGFTISQGGVLTVGEVTKNAAIAVTASVVYGGVTSAGTRTVVVLNVPATPELTSPAGAFASLNKPIALRITAVHEPDSFDATGLPAGLVVNKANGVISGTPTEEGTFNVQLSAINEIGTGTKNLALLVSAPSPLTVTLGGTGAGTVTGIGKPSDPFPRSELRDVGRTYRLVAKPAAGSLFEGWQGGITSSSPVLDFVMVPNLALEARFIINPYLTRLGIYAGLVTSSSPTHASTGVFRLAVAKTGSFSGSLVYGGKGFPLKGLLSASGAFAKVIPRKGLPPLAVTLQLDLTPGSQAISGAVTDGVIDSALAGQHTVDSAGPLAGRYTLLLPPVGDSPELPQGAGYAAVTISAKGAIKLAGRLGDGTALSVGGSLLNGGTWPLYAALYSAGGSLSGTASFENLALSDFTGPLSWFKPLRPKDALYPNGWPAGVAVNLQGALYTGLSPLDTQLTAHGGALLGDQTQAYSVDTLGRVALQTPVLPKVKLKFSASTGLFGGSFLDPFTRATRSFTGAYMSKSSAAQGVFKGVEQKSGLVNANTPL